MSKDTTDDPGSSDDPHTTTRGQNPDGRQQIARLSMPQSVVSLLLNAVAGWVDAVGYLALLASVQMFPSFMSGNLTKIVTGAVTGDGRKSLMIAGGVLAFFAGGVVGRLVNGGEARRDPVSLSLVAALLGVAAINLLAGGHEYLTLLALAAGMGMINHAFSGHMHFKVRTFLSGLWLTLSAAVADVIAGRSGWRVIVVPLVTLLSVLSGAFAGALSVTHATLVVSIVVPAAVIVAVVVALLAGLVREEDGSDPDG